MRTISVREMKAQWSDVEARVQAGEIIEVSNRGRPSVRIVPAGPARITNWDDHMASAIPGSGKTAEETLAADREGRW